MTQRTYKLIVAAATGLFVLVASSAAIASFTIAPFTLKAKSKIYTFYYPTVSGYTFLGSRDYVPGEVTTTSNFPNGPLSGYLSGPQTVHVQSGQYYASYYYAFNPYWGAQHAPGIPSTNAILGTNPAITVHAGVAVLTDVGLAVSKAPNFTVATGQIKLTGSGYVSPAGPYLGTTSNLVQTNGFFDLKHGGGPGSVTFTALPNADSLGEVRYTSGPNQFGGTLSMLGGTSGTFKNVATGPCGPGAVSCYHVNTFEGNLSPRPPPFPNSGTQNQWVDLFDGLFVNVFTFPLTPSLNTQTTTKTATGKTIGTSFKATTGKVVMYMNAGSFPTIHTTTGTDARTSNGLGNITLVEGWMGHTYTSGQSHWGGYTVYKFTFGAASQTPSLASPALGALGGLMAIAAVYVIRKRSAN